MTRHGENAREAEGVRRKGIGKQERDFAARFSEQEG